MSDVSEQVQRFLRSNITSVTQLEILLLLHTNPRQVWSSVDIARDLRIEAAGAKAPLEALTATGLVKRESEDAYRYAPVNAELDEGTIATAQAYLMRRVTVIGLIFASPSEKIRAFSDAFRIRKDPPNG